MIPAKRVGRGSMVVPLGGDAASLTTAPASSPHLAPLPVRMAQVELRTPPCNQKLCSAALTRGSPSSLKNFATGPEPARAVHRGRTRDRRRARYGLPVDYPATAPTYSAWRSERAWARARATSAAIVKPNKCLAPSHKSRAEE